MFLPSLSTMHTVTSVKVKHVVRKADHTKKIETAFLMFYTGSDIALYVKNTGCTNIFSSGSRAEDDMTGKNCLYN